MNNAGLCGFGFPSLRVCNGIDNTCISDIPFGVNTDKTIPGQQTMMSQKHPDQAQTPRIAIIAGTLTAAIALIFTGSLTFYHYRREKQKIGSMIDVSESRLSNDHSRDICSRSASPRVSLKYSTGWDLVDDGLYGSRLVMPEQFLQGFKFTLEEVESATRYFSETNLLGRSNFWAVYKGILRDGSHVAIKSINVTSCKSEETDFVNGLNLLISLRHENLVRLRGFCCSKGWGECFLVYDFAPKGNLSRYLDLEDGSSQALNWSTRISIIKGIARGKL